MTTQEASVRQRFSMLTSGLSQLGEPATEYLESPYFGDYALTARWPDIQIRVIRDKGRESAEVRPGHEAEDWFDLPLIQTLLTGRDTGGESTIEEQAGFIADHLAEILQAFAQVAWPLTKHRLESLERARAEKSLGPLPDRE